MLDGTTSFEERLQFIQEITQQCLRFKRRILIELLDQYLKTALNGHHSKLDIMVDSS